MFKKLKNKIESRRNSKNVFWFFLVLIKDFFWNIYQKNISFIHTLKEPGKVFSEVYKKNMWGGRENEFYSGYGSHENFIIQPYINIVADYLKHRAAKKPTIVDLGCGDFNVGKNFIDYCSKYFCVDVVPEIIEKLKKENYPDHVKFLCLDITKDALPDGDICFVRQVLQHLSNKQIITVLSKLKKYKVAFITEHYPAGWYKITPNKNIAHGPFTRVAKNSGVFLDKPPFNIPANSLELVLEIPLPNLNGVIRTYKIELSFA